MQDRRYHRPAEKEALWPVLRGRSSAGTGASSATSPSRASANTSTERPRCWPRTHATKWLASPEASRPGDAHAHGTVSHLLDSWLVAVKKRAKIRTYVGYESVVRVHLKPRIGDLDPQKVTSRHVTAMLADMETAVKAGRKEGSTEKVGPRTREIAYIIIGQAFRMLNPGLLDNVEKPKSQAEEMRPWSAEETRQFLAHVDETGDPHATMYRVALTTGLRKGEIFALTVDDVNFRTGHVSITKTWDYARMVAETPKTRSSRRTVVPPERTRVALRSYIMATGVRGDSRIFQFEVRNFSKCMVKAMRSAKVPVIRFHDLRHTYATLALAGGQNVKVISESLGHASVKITLDVYTHVMPGQAEQVAEAVDALIG